MRLKRGQVSVDSVWYLHSFGCALLRLVAPFERSILLCLFLLFLALLLFLRVLVQFLLLVDYVCDDSFRARNSLHTTTHTRAHAAGIPFDDQISKLASAHVLTSLEPISLSSTMPAYSITVLGAPGNRAVPRSKETDPAHPAEPN